MSDGFSTIEAAVAAFRRGDVIVVVDAEDRENEGDFVCAAEKATPEVVNFMIRHGRGQVCMPILPDVARRLDLPMMVQANSTPLGTAFTVPVDHLTQREVSRSGDVTTDELVVLADVDEDASGRQQSGERVDIDLGDLAHSLLLEPSSVGSEPDAARRS